MVKILVFLFSFFSFLFQSQEPVSWKYELDKIDNYQYKLTFNAEIRDGWKLYSQYSPIEENATEFVFLNPDLNSAIKEKFDERFSMIGDFDLFLRLSKLCIFESIQSPLAFARIHSKSLTQVMKEKETQEMEIWLKENKCNLNESYLKIIKEKTDYRKFVNFKIEGNYKECLKMLLNFKIKIFNIKGLIILFTPIVLLKKLLWYHQN